MKRNLIIATAILSILTLLVTADAKTKSTKKTSTPHTVT